MKSIKQQYIAALSGVLDNQYIALYWKGRVGLYALLKAMDIHAGDEVILPAFTCVVVPSAIIYLGATPIFVDIERDSYSCTAEAIEKVITPRSKAIICQNTFGLSFEIESILTLATKHSLYTIEDCTHGFGGFYKGKPNGTFCDAALYSTQWNKPFSTGVGGFISVKNRSLIERIKKVNQDAEYPKVGEQLQLLLLVLAKKIMLNKYSYWPLLRLYRWLSSNKIVVGSSSPGELSGTIKPEAYFKRGGFVQSMVGVAAFKNLDAVITRRKSVGEMYTKKLIGLGKNHVDPIFFENHSFLTYPVLVHDRGQFSAMAEAQQVPLGDWFNSPLHPVRDNLSRWGLDVVDFPVAQHCSTHIVNLPTNPDSLDGVLNFLEKNVDMIIDASAI